MRSLRSRYHLVALAGHGLGAAALAVGLPARVPFWWTRVAGAAIPLGALMVAFLLPTAVALTGILVRDLCIGHRSRNQARRTPWRSAMPSCFASRCS
jgi:hypothetical protein